MYPAFTSSFSFSCFSLCNFCARPRLHISYYALNLQENHFWSLTIHCLMLNQQLVRPPVQQVSCLSFSQYCLWLIFFLDLKLLRIHRLDPINLSLHLLPELWAFVIMMLHCICVRWNIIDENFDTQKWRTSEYAGVFMCLTRTLRTTVQRGAFWDDGPKPNQKWLLDSTHNLKDSSDRSSLLLNKYYKSYPSKCLESGHTWEVREKMELFELMCAVAVDT